MPEPIPQLRVSGTDPLPGKANYIIGNDPAKCHTNVPTYAKVRYASVYPGVDLVYYGNQRQLEYDFIVAPGASAKSIRLRFAGAEKLSLTDSGDLTIKAKDGEIAFHKPVAYQEINGKHEPILGQFALLSHNTVGFTIGSYNSAQPLIIDPVLAYSTYLGGSFLTWAYGIAVDTSGNAYITGYTDSTDFPVTTGAFQTGSYRGMETSGFVTKLNSKGTALLYSTYLVGSGGEYPYAIAVDGSGDAFVVGEAYSGFPVTTGTFEPTYPNSGGGHSGHVGFITRLNPNGSALEYSTYLGWEWFRSSHIDCFG